MRNWKICLHVLPWQGKCYTSDMNISKSHETACPPRAFSLVELLTVIAILSVLMTVSAPVLSSFRRSGDVNSAVFNVSLLLEQARSYALANNVHVWVGFRNDGDSFSVASVAGVTGSSDDILSSATFRPLMKPRKFANIKLASTSGFNGIALTAEELGPSTSLTFSQNVAGVPVIFDQVIEFGPNGGARLTSAAVPRWIQIGLQPSLGDKQNDAAIQIAGLTGQVRIFRR